MGRCLVPTQPLVGPSTIIGRDIWSDYMYMDLKPGLCPHCSTTRHVNPFYRDVQIGWDDLLQSYEKGEPGLCVATGIVCILIILRCSTP